MDDLAEILSKNDTILDYELFKKTDEVDSFLRQVITEDVLILELNPWFRNSIQFTASLQQQVQ